MKEEKQPQKIVRCYVRNVIEENRGNKIIKKNKKERFNLK
jgi:hypothetical protein